MSPRIQDLALQWFKRAALLGDTDAAYNAGVMYLNGRGVAQDDAEAAKWFRMSAEGGDTQAQMILGLMYEIGRGVAQDDAEAGYWLGNAGALGE